MTNILIFGDSISWGAWDKKGGWTQRLKAFVDGKNLTEENYDCAIYNLGVSGDTTEELIERIEVETTARLGESETILIFAIGLNDSQILEKDSRFSLEQFRENLYRLVEKSKKFSSKIIFLGLTPVEDEKVDPVPWAPQISYRNENVRRFNEEIKNFCKEENFNFIEIFENLSKKDYKILLEDGAHPNTKGHEEMFIMVKDFLEKRNVI